MISSFESLLPLALSLAVAGAIAGVIAGLLGVGGGIIIVPVMLEFLAFASVAPEAQMHIAVGTSLATIVATSISSTRSHHKRGGVDWALWRLFGPSVAVGVLIGTAIASHSPGKVLALTFAVVALAAAGYMTFFPGGPQQGDIKPPKLVVSVCGAFVGAISTMIGIGGGTLTVPTFVLFGTPIQRAIGTSAAVGLIIAVIGCAGFIYTGYGRSDLPPFSLGYVNLTGLAAIIPTTVLMAPVGAWLAHKLPPLLVKRFFAAFLVVAAVRLILKSL